MKPLTKPEQRPKFFTRPTHYKSDFFLGAVKSFTPAFSRSFLATLVFFLSVVSPQRTDELALQHFKFSASGPRAE